MSLTKVSYSMIQGAEYNVLDFGFSPSNTAAANATAFAAIVSSVADGSVIYFPAGTYEISATITLTKKLVLVGAPANSRGTQSAVIKWTGADGAAWSTGPKMFVVAQGATGLGTTFMGLGFYTEKSYVTMIDGTAAFNLLVQECQFASNQYNKAIELKQSAPSAADGSFWTRIEDNNFANTWVSVADDSNGTWISGNNFWAEIAGLAGSSLYIQGDINAVYVENNSFEGTWSNTGPIYAVNIDLVSNFSFINNRVENYSGGSATFSRLINQSLIQNNLFNTPPAIGGSRETSAHGVGQSVTEFSNWYASRTASRFIETSSLAGVFPGKNAMVQAPIGTWTATNLSTAMVQTGATGLRCPVLRLHTPTGGTSAVYQDENILSTPQMQLAVQNEQYVTGVLVVKAKSTNVGTSVFLLNTGDTPEYVTIPKDDKWHVIRLSRRLYSTDTTLYPTVYLSYASSYNAADELWIGGLGVYMGTGSFDIPFFDGWTTDPASASNTGYWQIGEIARNVAPASSQPQGWVCTVTGAPGTWKALANIA